MELLQARPEVLWLAHDVTGEYAAHEAARRGMDRVIAWMLERNPQVARQRTIPDGYLPWRVAQESGWPELGDMLRRKFSRANDD